MLVLTRRTGEQLVLTVQPSDKPTTIVVQLCEVRTSTSAKIGVDAPKSVKIDRPDRKLAG